MPEAEQFADEMTPYDEVRQFNVATIGENGEENQPTVIETAEQVSNEQTVQRNADEVEVVVSETENTTNDAYSIAPAQYTTKRGKVLDMFLVKPNDELGKSEQREANARAREMKGWWDKNAGGFMLRSEDDARQFAEQTFSNPIGTTSSADEVQAAREATNTNPTEAQKEAGNYTKGHIKVDGYDIVLENPKGSTRSGKDANGKAWSITMNYDYGYLSRTEGVDGDHIDVYLSDNPASGNVYVVDQINQSDGSFDEHKVMYGFPSMDAAREAYASQYEDGWKIGPITEVSREEFKKWVNSSKRKTKPFAEYKNVKKTAEHNEQANEPIVDARDPKTWVGWKFFTNGMILKCTSADNNYAQFDNLTTYMGMGFDVPTFQKMLDRGEVAPVKDKRDEQPASEPKQEQAANTSLMSDTGSSRDEQEVKAAEGKTFKSERGLILYVDRIDNGRVFYEITDIDGTTERYDTSIPAMADALQRWEEVTVTDNNNNNETNRTAAEQAEANTEAIASEAETTASEAEAIAETATTEQEVNEAEQAINDKLEEVESQLALLGYYEGEEVAKDFNEAYGYLRNAEKKAVNDALQLAKKIAKYLGLVTPKKKDVRSNIAPIGGDVHFSLPLDDTHNLYFNFQLDRDEDNYDNLKLKGIMFRVENSDTNVRDRGDNNFLPTNSTFEDIMKEIRRALKYAMPEFVVPEKSEKEAQNADNKKGNEAKTSKSKKKAVTSGQEAQTNLFGDLFGSADVNENDNENDTAEPRSDEAEGNTNRTVGDVPADGNGVLEPESTGATDGGNSDAAGTGNERLADGEPQGLSTDGSRGGSTERNNVAGEEQSDGTDGGRSVSTGDAEDGRRSTGETSTGSRKTTKRDSDRRIDDGSKKTANERNNPKNTRNYLYGKDAEEIDNMSEKQRLATNVEALETLVQVLREKRDATAEERALMGKFRGWGGIDLSRFYSQRQLLSSNAHTSQYNPETGERELFPNNFVWAEVEYAADNDYQQEAHDMGLNENGKYVHSLAGLKHLPTDGFYMYRTNVDPTTDPWVITGAMKVNRLLTPTEVDKMVKDAGREPQARQEGAVTDEQINALNKEIAERNATDAESIAKAAKKTGKKLGTKVRIVENVEELTDKDARKQKRMRRAKGWYDTATGEVVVVVPNADNVADVVATVLHEVVGHEGLRKVVGAQHFDNFLRKVYERSNRATRAAINALAAKNGWNFSLATEEYIAEMAESGFNNRENLGTWERIKQFFKDMLSAAKIAVGIDINDNDLRYMLWRSYQMQQSRGAMGVAEDIAMQQQLGVGNYADTNRYRNGGSLPTDDVTDVVKGLRQEYDEAMKKSGFQVQEAIQDSMLSLKKLMDILQKHSGKAEIADWENAYTAENALSSRNKAEQDEFKRKYYNPLMEAMRALKDDMTEEEIGDYVMAKHGIERNREMSVRAALTDDGGVLDKTMLAKWNKRKDDVRNDTSLPTWRDKQEALDEIAVNEFGADLYARDYSGLTSLYKFDDVEDAVNTAYGVVDDVEWRNPTATEKLGNAIKNANAATLEKLFTSGMINRETKESIAQMYDYYVPLRGFDETTAEEVYAYVRDERKSFNNPLKRSKGRSSKADNPFAHILSMADSAILQGNKNLMKQKFLNFVLNRPSDLVSVSDMWIKKDPVTDEWVTAFPTIPDDATPEEVADIVRQFNEDMQTEVDNGNPDIKRIKGKTADVPYRTLHDQISSHQVIVKRDGKEYVMTINANPRAAMALNGQTNPHSDYKGVGGAFKRSADYINRQLAGWYTTKNPDFVASNFVRDALYSNSMVWVKESPRYAVRFHKNFVKFNPKKMGKLFHKFNNGTLDMSDPVEKEFYRFMMNGGETGYSNLKDIEELKKELTKDLKNTKLHQMKALLDRFDIINRSVENCARFAAYMSSREENRSVQRAVFDAKEISVNFNKKGAGGTFFGAVGQTKLGSMAASSSAACRALYVFFNAGVQGTTNILRAAKHNKKKFGALAASYFILGYLAPMLMGGGDGDDDDKFTNYDDLPDYVRRTNLIIPIGSSYISLPLPIEFRTMYGMGELASNVLSGKERYTGTQLARTMTEQVTQALPINFLDGEGTGVLSPFVPSAVAPLYQAHENMDWTGMPIYKDNDYNKKKPEYTKAFGRTNRHLVNLAEGLNNATGGDEFSKGAIDLNPALVEHIVQGYFGGAVTFLNKMSNSIDMATGEMEPDWRNVPIANRLVKSGSEYTKQRAINREYFSNLDQWEEIQQREKGYIGKLQSPQLSLEEKAEWAEKLEDLHKSDEWQNMQVFNFLNKQVKKMGELQKAMPQENPELARDIWHLKRQANEVARGEFDDESK